MLGLVEIVVDPVLRGVKYQVARVAGKMVRPEQAKLDIGPVSGIKVGVERVFKADIIVSPHVPVVDNELHPVLSHPLNMPVSDGRFSLVIPSQERLSLRVLGPYHVPAPVLSLLPSGEVINPDIVRGGHGFGHRRVVGV